MVGSFGLSLESLILVLIPVYPVLFSEYDGIPNLQDSKLIDVHENQGAYKMTDFQPVHPCRRILVAGGAGFIGSHLVIRLLEDPLIERVVVLDNFCTGNPENLSPVLNDPRLKLIETDITDLSPIEGRYDAILHLAAIANPTDYETSPLQTLLVNSRGNEALIELAKKDKARYIFFSSSEVYGYYENIPPEGLQEDAVSHLILNQGRSPYPIGKCFGEEMTKHLCRSNGIPYVIIRPFNVYGPRMDTKTQYGRVIPNFIIWAMRQEALQVQGDGQQIRTFCYIDDFIDALSLVLYHPHPPTVMNIGSPTPTPIGELARLTQELLSGHCEVIFTERYPYETPSRIPDIRLITSLGWKPVTGLKEGILKTARWVSIVKNPSKN